LLQGLGQLAAMRYFFEQKDLLHSSANDLHVSPAHLFTNKINKQKRSLQYAINPGTAFKLIAIEANICHRVLLFI
jgi:hypothetical protein